jgi:hypothetical protein
MRITMLSLVLLGATARADETKVPADVAKEMTQAMHLLDSSLGLESYPPPHCLRWGSGKPITADETRECAKKALEGQALPGLGKHYVIAILMAEVGPQTLIALSLDAAGWAMLSCDPGRPCPPRHAGTDKMGKRVVERTARACASATTIWLPEKKGCP